MSSNVQTLIASLNSSDLATRRGAAESIAQLGSDAAAAAVSLVKACGDDDEQVRNWVVAALEDLPAPDAADAGALEALINVDMPLDVAYWATTLLGRMEAAAASTVPTLAAAVAHHPELVVRQRAVWALGKIGTPAADAIPQLEAAATSEDPRLARSARAALESIRS